MRYYCPTCDIYLKKAVCDNDPTHEVQAVQGIAVITQELLKYIFIVATGYRRIDYSGKQDLEMADFRKLATLSQVTRGFHDTARSITVQWPPVHFQVRQPLKELLMTAASLGLEFRSLQVIARRILQNYPPTDWLYVPVGASPFPLTVFMAMMEPRATICHVVMSGRRNDPDLGLPMHQHTRQTPRSPLNNFIFGRFLPPEKIQNVLTGGQNVLVIDWSHGHALGLACNYIYRFLHDQSHAVQQQQVVGLSLYSKFPLPRKSHYSYKTNPQGDGETPRSFFNGFYLRALACPDEERKAFEDVSSVLHNEKYKKIGVRGMPKAYPVDFNKAFNSTDKSIDVDLRVKDILWCMACYLGLSAKDV